MFITNVRMVVAKCNIESKINIKEAVQYVWKVHHIVNCVPGCQI